jgi:hypothetical protein
MKSMPSTFLQYAAVERDILSQAHKKKAGFHAKPRSRKEAAK